MEWTVVTVISTLLGMAAVLIPVVWKLSAHMSELKTSLDNLTQIIKETKQTLKEYEGTLADHEKRITRLEDRKK